ncbi:nucleotide-binding protein [Roseibacillus persicicus]|uniref:nucleotide-binding protein n=1 Tax=Roseibacillus persicicus TaxID=454148 RepID=UPI00280F11C0|nr:nucleotide-binding protein [Roseibacillus persicicus]MDQ8192694.1 nucleotide-binding protein [Roseibacillus persicicus]
MSLEFVKTDTEKVTYLVNLLTARATGEDASDSDYEKLRSELLRNPRINELLPNWLRTHRSLGSFWAFIKVKFGTYADRRKYLWEEFENALNVLEFGESVEKQALETDDVINVDVPSLPPAMDKKGKVFLVHGRDNEAKQEVARYVESLGIGAIILHEQASSGMTIIEKIERYANEVDFAIVLYTACDHGRGIHESKVHPRNRARQNVVFEHGYLMAKLGRENVCALVKGEIETPNDISGVVYVGLDVAGAWKAEVTKELKACGYPIGH